MPDNALFEERALKKLQSPELLDESVSFVPIPLRLAIGGIGLLSVLGLGWSIFGRIPEQVSGMGLIIDRDSVYNLATTASGVLVYNYLPIEGGNVDEQRNRRFFKDLSEVSKKINNARDRYQALKIKEMAIARRSDSIANTNYFGDIDFDKALTFYEEIDRERISEMLEASEHLFQQGLRGGYGARKRPLQSTIEALPKDMPFAFVVNEADLLSSLSKLSQLDEAYRSYKSTYFANSNLIKLANTNINYLKKSLEATRKAYKVGVVSKLSVESGLNDLQQAETKIYQSRLEIKKTESGFRQSLIDFIDQLTAFIENGIITLPDHNLSIDALTANSGQYLQAGTQVGIASQVPTSETDGLTTAPRIISVYMDNASGQKTSIGQRAIVTPEIIQKSEYGGILGEVISTPTPIMSTEQLDNMFPYEGFNTDLTNAYTVPVSVQVKLLLDEEGNYKWSGNLTPPYPVRSYTVATVSITTLNKAPISYLVPAFKTLLGPLSMIKTYKLAN
ncbi:MULTISPECIES: TolC family protein [Prochlorococcus]|uniref:TolC family protein n=1 Tax=Prochlorococcus TaxID=1218 RepID=UPI0007B3BB54|nr:MULTISPECIES: TolC family protein [Prochlorococcus]KZR72383.1 Outer membrane efflux protein [Prochlorococcus marinus str. MIT 1312]NMP05798.1 TolC family protein [Prochlorococcus sp. P1361]